MCNGIENAIRAFASSRVCPVATQPGKSGTYAPNPEPSSAGAIMTRYWITFSDAPVQSGLLQNSTDQPMRQRIAFMAVDRDGALLNRMSELPMASLLPFYVPAIAM
jgi:hypothetical protein